MENTQANASFTSYEKFAIFILAVTQFSVILDFMVMAPLGDMLMKSLRLSPKEFGFAVSGYAISAGISGLFAAGFADRYDRKKLLLFFYFGFIVGTLLCSLVSTFEQLLAARIFTGIFGGVIGSISMAIITDIFAIHQRGRVMGFVQMGFGASGVVGVPLCLFIANHWGWRSPFLLIVAIAVVVALAIVFRLRPVTAHLGMQQTKNPLRHIANTMAKGYYRMGFLATALLSVGGFMMMPFGAAFAINNLHVSQARLPILFMISGSCSLIVMPIMGKLSDKLDKFRMFAVSSLWMILVVCIYTNQSSMPFWLVGVFYALLMMGIMGRMVPATTLITGVPAMHDRGAFMSINASLQQIAGGIAAMLAGSIVVQRAPSSPLENYNIVGYLVSIISLVAIGMLYRVDVMVKQRVHGDVAKQPPAVVATEA